MDVAHVAHVGVRPPAGVVDQPAGILLPHCLHDARRIVLAPALVERHPHHDARMVATLVDQRVELRFEVLRGLGRARRAAAQHGARHVLPHEQAQPVGPVVPALGLDLDVLARHVEAELLRDVDIRSQGFVGRRGVEPVGPPPLVERSDLEQRRVVEAHPRDAVGILAERRLAHAEVRRYLVHRAARSHERDAQVVEERRVGRPELRAGHAHRERPVRLARRARHLARSVQRDRGHGRVRRVRAASAGRDLDRAGVDVRYQRQRVDGRVSDRLDPHRLPDPRDRRVPDAAGPIDLLAARLRAGVRRVPHGDDQLLRTVRAEGPA